MKSLYRYLIMVCLTLVPVGMMGQEAGEEESLEAATLDVQVRMLAFEEELNQLYAMSMFQLKIDNEMPLTEPLLDVVSERLKSLNTQLQSFTVRWNTYSQAQQVYVAESDSLLNQTAWIQQLQQAVTDTLALRQQQYEQLAAFTKAEAFVFGQDSVYRRLYSQAAKLSLVSKLAPQLGKVKAEEQLVFANVQSSYEKAKEAADVFPGLDLRMKAIDQKFVELKNVSGKIQEFEYKPFIQRIKDYLIGLAAVAILMMFVNLLVARMKTLKQVRDQAKKLKQQVMGQRDYPTI